MKIKKFIVACVCLVTLLSCSGLYAQTRIRFARGRTSASLSGTLAAGATRRFVLGATRGQELSGNISSRNNCVTFTGESTSTSVTTTRGDNWISITNNCERAAARYTMTVSINY